MTADQPFDRALRRVRRDRAATRFGQADYLHRLAGEELLERLDSVKRSFRDALLLGAADRHLADALRNRGLRVIAADPGFRFAAAVGGVQCDEDRLPFADSAFDLVLSVGMLDSVNDLPGALTLIRRTLRADGLLLAALAGAGSLSRIKAAMLAADSAAGSGAAARVHPQIDVRAAGDLLTRAGFVLPVADTTSIDVRFPGLTSLLGDLRAMAGGNLLPAGVRTPIRRLGYAAAISGFAGGAGEDGKTAERFQIITLTAWAPSPDQPRPAQRGSGAASLAAVLGTKAAG